jgi:hypothetical protein
MIFGGASEFWAHLLVATFDCFSRFVLEGSASGGGDRKYTWFCRLVSPHSN